MVRTAPEVDDSVALLDDRIGAPARLLSAAPGSPAPNCRDILAESRSLLTPGGAALTLGKINTAWILKEFEAGVYAQEHQTYARFACLPVSQQAVLPHALGRPWPV